MQKKVELEPAVTISGFTMVPVALTVSYAASRGWNATTVVCREALGVIVREAPSLRVYLADGRTLSLDEFVSIYPSLADAVAALE
ncbi:MAG: hypothetical protein JW846_11225 [Dehalococcoidia bacterium]|nr:hypothetical protein [Dehalococcoidia bacterium]